MQIHKKANLKPFHTFAIDVTCDLLVIVESKEELISAYRNPEWQNMPKLLVGKGSNLLFTEHFKGVVIVNRILGIEVTETEQSWNIHVCGGEDWPELVRWSLDKGYFGLENLALIPGCAGSAPIQNIGAYGVEFKDVCDYVDVLYLDSMNVSRINKKQCLFGYRDSIFKKDLYGKVAIIAVGLTLSKQWNPVVNYGSLQNIPENELSALRVYQEVCHTRMSKLPDPEKVGNAGSFFKNPVVSEDDYNALQERFPAIVGFPVEDGVKLAAGWLIDNCGLKGTTVGGAAVHENQALVIINKGNAQPDDVVELAKSVCTQVWETYGVCLEHEVRFMNSSCETRLGKFGDN